MRFRWISVGLMLCAAMGTRAASAQRPDDDAPVRGERMRRDFAPGDRAAGDDAGGRQRGGPFGGRGNFSGPGAFGVNMASGAMLLRMKEVRDELAISDDVSAKLDDLWNEMQEDARASFNPEEMQELSPEERQEKFEEFRKKTEQKSEDADKKIGKLLSKKQNDRLGQLKLQREGATALLKAEVAKALKLTKKQKDRLETIQEESRPQFARGGPGGRGPGGFAGGPGNGGPGGGPGNGFQGNGFQGNGFQGNGFQGNGGANPGFANGQQGGFQGGNNFPQGGNPGFGNGQQGGAFQPGGNFPAGGAAGGLQGGPGNGGPNGGFGQQDGDNNRRNRQGFDREAARAFMKNMQEQREKMEEDMLAVLNKSQLAQWTKMKGKEFEFPQPQFGRRRGGDENDSRAEARRPRRDSTTEETVESSDAGAADQEAEMEKERELERKGIRRSTRGSARKSGN